MCYNRPMKPKNFSLLLLLMFLLIALTSCAQAASTAQPPPQAAEDNSIIGSTDGIFVMGVLIVLITSLPLFLRRKKK